MKPCNAYMPLLRNQSISRKLYPKILTPTIYRNHKTTTTALICLDAVKAAWKTGSER